LSKRENQKKSMKLFKIKLKNDEKKYMLFHLQINNSKPNINEVIQEKNNLLNKVKQTILDRETFNKTLKKNKENTIEEFHPSSLIKDKNPTKLKFTPYQYLINTIKTRKSRLKDIIELNKINTIDFELKSQFKTIDNSNFFLDISNKLSSSGEILYNYTLSKLNKEPSKNKKKQEKYFFFFGDL